MTNGEQIDLPLNDNGSGDGAGDLLRMALSSTGVLESGDSDMPTGKCVGVGFSHSPHFFSVETPNEMNFDDVFSASFSAAASVLDEPKPQVKQNVVNQIFTKPVNQTVKLAVQKPDVLKLVSKMPKLDLKRSATSGKNDLK